MKVVRTLVALLWAVALAQTAAAGRYLGEEFPAFDGLDEVGPCAVGQHFNRRIGFAKRSHDNDCGIGIGFPDFVQQ